jgi:hypothetical protein
MDGYGLQTEQTGPCCARMTGIPCLQRLFRSPLWWSRCLCPQTKLNSVLKQTLDRCWAKYENVLGRWTGNTSHAFLKECYSVLSISSFNAKLLFHNRFHAVVSHRSPKDPYLRQRIVLQRTPFRPLAPCALLVILATEAIAMIYGFFGPHLWELYPLPQATSLHPLLKPLSDL